MVGVYDLEMANLGQILRQDDRNTTETGQLSLLIREMDFFIIHARAHIQKKRLSHLWFSHTGNVRVWFVQLKVYFRENSGVLFGELLTRLMGSVALNQLNAGGRTLSSLQKGKLETFRKEAMFFTLMRAREALGLVLDHCEVEKVLAAISKTDAGQHIEDELKEHLGIGRNVPLASVPLLVDHQVYLIRQYLANNQTNVFSNKRRRIGAEHTLASTTPLSVGLVPEVVDRQRFYETGLTLPDMHLAHTRNTFTARRRFWDNIEDVGDDDEDIDGDEHLSSVVEDSDQDSDVAPDNDFFTFQIGDSGGSAASDSNDDASIGAADDTSSSW